MNIIHKFYEIKAFWMLNMNPLKLKRGEPDFYKIFSLFRKSYKRRNRPILNVNAKNYRKETFLMVAADKMLCDVVDRFANHNNINLEATDKNGDTVVIRIVKKIVKLENTYLKKYAGNGTIYNTDDFYEKRFEQLLEVLKILLEAGAKVKNSLDVISEEWECPLKIQDKIVLLNDYANNSPKRISMNHRSKILSLLGKYDPNSHCCMDKCYN